MQVAPVQFYVVCLGAGTDVAAIPRWPATPTPPRLYPPRR